MSPPHPLCAHISVPNAPPLEVQPVPTPHTHPSPLSLCVSLPLTLQCDHRQPLSFCGFSEPEKWATGPLETRFYPTYKKDAKRGTAEAKGGRRFVVPHRTADIEAGVCVCARARARVCVCV